jgi:thioredoxin-dependent peroxiredoxin
MRLLCHCLRGHWTSGAGRANIAVMKKLLLAGLAVASAFAIPAAAPAQLASGAAAPQIVTQGALAGKAFSFNLNQALQKGPVVLYFYPKAFTQGCTLEANAFAEAMDDFTAAGATVVGLSADDLSTLKDFSTRECRDKFAVAIASKATIAAYDVSFKRDGQDTGLSNRTSFVIGQDRKIKLAFSDLNWNQHVARSLAAVRALKK